MASARQKVTTCKVASHGGQHTGRDASDNPPEADPALVSRFVQVMGRRGVTELAAQALLRQMRGILAKVSAGHLDPIVANARWLKLVLSAEDKAAELARVDIKAIADAVRFGSLTIGQARSKLRGAE